MNRGISIITVTRNSASSLDRFLASFLEVNTYSPVEVIILDQASGDNIQEVFTAYSSRLFMRKYRKSLDDSISALLNFGEQKAKYPYLLFVDQSFIFTDDVLPLALGVLTSRQATGAVGVQLENPAQKSGYPETIQEDSSSGLFEGPELGQEKEADRSDIFSPDSSFPLTPTVSAEFMLVERSDFQALNGFDDVGSFEQGYRDFCLRLRRVLNKTSSCLNGGLRYQANKPCSSLVKANLARAKHIPFYNIPLVVAAYNRPISLRRLLSSLDNAFYHGRTIPLIISIDGGEDSSGTLEEAKNFKWVHGPKTIISHDQNLGLKDHILKCGDLTREYDGIVLLEDDLLVSPAFYTFLQQAFDYYSQDQDVAGMSLYAHSFNETAKFPFVPLQDHSDVYFMQVPASWGVAWSREQWSGFRSWMEEHGDKPLSKPLVLPWDVIKWPDSSWKKIFYKYIMAKNKYFLYPRFSLTTNFAEDGVHMKKNNVFQVPLRYGEKDFCFVSLENSVARYDGFCEILPECLSQLYTGLSQYDYSVDLYGMKPLIGMQGKHILTSKKAGEKLLSFGREMIPQETNIIHQVKGDHYFLAPRGSCPGIKGDYQELLLESSSVENILYHYNIPGWRVDAACKKRMNCK